MTTAQKSTGARVDQFFTGAETRFDRWRSLLQAARAWEGAASQQRPENEKYQAVVSASGAELRQWGDFFAYPGRSLLRSSGSESCPSCSMVGTGTRATQIAQTTGQVYLRTSFRR